MVGRLYKSIKYYRRAWVILAGFLIINFDQSSSSLFRTVTVIDVLLLCNSRANGGFEHKFTINTFSIKRRSSHGPQFDAVF